MQAAHAWLSQFVIENNGEWAMAHVENIISFDPALLMAGSLGSNYPE